MMSALDTARSHNSSVIVCISFYAAFNCHLLVTIYADRIRCSMISCSMLYCAVIPTSAPSHSLRLSYKHVILGSLTASRIHKGLTVLVTAGGSLAMLTLVLYELHHRRRHPGIRPTCYTFGSPPVLSHRQGGGGQRVLDALHLPPDTIRDFVLEHDPVPRALLSVDPAFQMLKGWSAVKGLLQLRELLAGEGSPLSPTRFLFEAVGQVYLVRWTQEGGSEVVSLDAHEIESALSLAATNAADPSTAAGEAAAATTATATAVTQADSTPTSTVGPDSIITASTATPVGEGGVTVPSTAAGQATAASNTASASPSWFDPTRTMQAMLDHYHGSYAQELEAAALSALKREMPR
eukprot:GHRR01013703.1.p1 GENE.GHRR01013703.1~~GHRR01013703.1.p1  ORF type:complete len:350 (+),score=101.70 GHRR01013703.1:1725-2774(+)